MQIAVDRLPKPLPELDPQPETEAVACPAPEAGLPSALHAEALQMQDDAECGKYAVYWVNTGLTTQPDGDNEVAATGHVGIRVADVEAVQARGRTPLLTLPLSEMQQLQPGGALAAFDSVVVLVKPASLEAVEARLAASGADGPDLESIAAASWKLAGSTDERPFNLVCTAAADNVVAACELVTGVVTPLNLPGAMTERRQSVQSSGRTPKSDLPQLSNRGGWRPRKSAERGGPDDFYGLRSRHDFFALCKAENAWVTAEGNADALLESARSKYIRGCQDLEVLPMPMLIRKSEDVNVSTVVDLNGYHMGDTMAKVLATSSPFLAGQGVGIRELLLASNSCSPQGCVALCTSISACPLLQLLDLSGNHLGREGAKALCECIEGHAELAQIFLVDVHVSDASMCDLVRSMMTLQNLMVVDVSDNKLGHRPTDQAASTLAGLLKKNTPLQQLRVKWNCLRGKQAECIGQVRFYTSLFVRAHGTIIG